LIINELISNSLKYAFPEDREGEIKVSLCRNDKGEVELTVRDNGIGIPEDVDFRNTGTLGLNLVNALVGQLQGRIELYREGGTEFIIRFKE
jgi:two-component sensor histidine kinase